MFYKNVVSKLLSFYNRAAWTVEELASLRSKIAKLETAVHRAFAVHCSSGLLTSTNHHLGHALEDKERFRALSFTDAATFEHHVVLIKQFYRMTSRRYLARMFEKMHNMSRAYDSVRRGESQVHEGVVGAYLLRKTK